MPYEKLTRSRLTLALKRLGELASENGTVLEVSLYGGAVFTLVYASREATKDVDAVIHPVETAKRLASQVAIEQDLSPDWLNDDVRYFLSEVEAKRTAAELDFGPGLHVSVPTAAYLLAMKLRSARLPLPGYPGDRDDIRFLLTKMEINSLEEAEAIFERFFPDDALTLAAKDEDNLALAQRKK